MANFIEFNIETDEEALIELFYTAMVEAFPEWTPAAGNYEVWLARAWARMGVEIAELAVDVPPELFHQFGEKILGLPPIEAAPATAQTTWTVQDTDGYTIFAGTLISIQQTGSELIGFEVQNDVIIPPGSATAEDITVEAVEPGEYANGAAGPVTLIDALPFVTSITLDDSTANGADDEDPEAYLNRLTSEARLLSPRPVLPHDAAVLARRVVGVYRAVALDLYNPNTDTWDNEKTTTVAVADEDGEVVSAGIKDEVETLLAAMREINFEFYVIDPTYTDVNVTFDVEPLSGYVQGTVNDNVIAALTEYLSPGTWGAPRFADSNAAWSQGDTVYLNELIALIDGVAGVDRVNSVTLAADGNPLSAADVSLAGPAPLTRPGTLTGS